MPSRRFPILLEASAGRGAPEEFGNFTRRHPSGYVAPAPGRARPARRRCAAANPATAWGQEGHTSFLYFSRQSVMRSCSGRASRRRGPRLAARRADVHVPRAGDCAQGDRPQFPGEVRQGVVAPTPGCRQAHEHLAWLTCSLVRRRRSHTQEAEKSESMRKPGTQERKRQRDVSHTHGEINTKNRCGPICPRPRACKAAICASAAGLPARWMHWSAGLKRVRSMVTLCGHPGPI